MAGNGNGNGRRRFRRGHRWIGTALAVFVLFLSITGVALNHAHDLGLDRRYVSWPWLLEAYGLGPPDPYAGMVRLGELVVVGDDRRAHVLLASGELVESIDLADILPGRIERVGHAAGRVVLQSEAVLYRSDTGVAAFVPWNGGEASDVEWSAAVDFDSPGLEALQAAWRGRGLTVERILLDLHSGRIFSLPGRMFMDIVALGFVLLSLSGLVLARRRNGKQPQ